MTPRPQHDEAFGSWLGRVAARYRIGVDELIKAAGIEVDIGERANAWLAAMPIGEGSIRRLCSLSRLSQGDLVRTLPNRPLRTSVFPCCFPCLMLNPWEVEAPYWPLRWLTGEGARCGHPTSEIENVTPGMLSQGRNMSRLMREIERKRCKRAIKKSAPIMVGRRC